MQWPNGSGEAYGEDPYGGVGYAYDYGHEGGSGTTDTAAPAWGPGQPGQGTQPYPTAWDAAYGDVPWGPVPHTQGTQPYPTAWDAAYGDVPLGPVPHAQGTQPYPTAWDAAYGDVLTVPSPQVDTLSVPFAPVPDPEPVSAPKPGPGPETPANEPVRPVFVDASGQRQRRVLRAARLLVIPAGGYVALLISTMLGGPSINSPFVPQPDATHPATPRVSASESPSGTGHPAGERGATDARANSGTATQKATSGTTGGSTAAAAPAATSGPTTATTTTTSLASGSTADPTSVPSAKGRAVGTSHKPVK